MDDEFDWDRDEIVDPDGGWYEATGNPAMDVDGYQSPRDTRNLTGYEPHPVNQDWLAQSKRDRERRAAKRAAAARDAERRREARRNESSGERHEQKSTPRAQPQPVQSDRDEIMRRSLTELQPGQHGAYFERRIKRCWWAPWRKRTVWQQVSAWMNTTPPKSGTEVVTVGSVDELQGKVHTIGTVGETGAVEY